MSEELLNIAKELSEKPTTELALQFMELTADNIAKEKGIDRLNNILDEYRNHLIKKMNEFVSYDGDLSKIYEEEFDYLDKLKELKENK